MRFRNYYIFFIVALALALSAVIVLNVSKKNNNEAVISKNVQQGFLKLNKTLDLNISRFHDQFDEDEPFDVLNKAFSEFWEKDQQQFLLYNESNRLIYWTGTEIPSDERIFEVENEAIIQLKNGWYYVKKTEIKGNKLIALALVYHQFTYENDYLISHPSRFFKQDFVFHFSDKEGIPIIVNNDEVLKFVQVSIKDTYLQKTHNSAVFLLLLAFLFFIFGFSKLIHSLPLRKAFFTFSLAIIGIGVLRVLGIYFKFPAFFNDTRIFSPGDYATSIWLPSLGDFFINAFILFYFVFQGFLLLRRSQAIQMFFKHNNKLSLVLFPTLIYSASLFIYDAIKGLMINSSLSLDFNDILSFNLYSIIALAIIVFLLGSYFFLSKSLIHIIAEKHQKSIFMAFLFIGILFGFVEKLFGIYDLFPLFWALISFYSLFYFFRNPQQKNYVFRAILMVFIFAFAATYILKYAGNKRNEEKQKLLAVKLSEERDPIAEFLFQEVEAKILNDDLLKTYLDPASPTGMPVRDLGQLYFNGYWDKYSIEVNVFGVDDCPLTNLYFNKISDPAYFEHIIDSISIPTPSRNFFYLDNSSGRISYLARMPIVQNSEGKSQNLGIIYISFDSRYTPEEIGYPELLLDKIATTNIDPANYSNARYKDGKLTGNFGNYVYTISDKVFRLEDLKIDEFRFVQLDGFDHLVYYTDPDALVVISFKTDNLLSYLTPFSYFFLIISLIVLIFSFFTQKQEIIRLHLFSFKRKVQFAVVLLILFALLLIATITIYFIINQNEQKNNRILSEKVFSILAQLEQNMGADVMLNPYLSEDVSFQLARLSNTFYTDINIYDRNGWLYASSRKKVFDEGLLAKQMDPVAYVMLKERTLTEFLQNESIGLMQYKSAYVNLRNNEGEILGYVNLPYFAKQSELRREISGFLVAVININVLLLVIVVLAAILISNSVTEPLRIIQEKLGAIRLGSKNEKIEWRGNDEIGDLVNEYNRMVEALGVSAEMLAKSERESAWREMAKQVAHEIKNPLTPMKLSLQHLKRAYDDGAPNWDKQLERFTHTMIEQIDTLSHIATEFSNFAKMPKMKREKVELVEMLNNVCDFYSKNEQVKIAFTTKVQKCFVNADKEQMLRVFNNLIKNAIQSLDENQEGKIDIRLQEKGDKVRVAIQDNGCGIEDDIKEKIFEPNFTTKTSGMGLGLALVKNIITTSEGVIWFDSTVGEGSIFYLEMPTHDSANYVS